MPLQATSGAASYDAFGGGAAAEPNYIESVFQTYLYTGNGSTQTITNGIDLSTKGGLTWIKERSGDDSGNAYHCLFDTARGVGKALYSNVTLAQSATGTALTAFNTTGFSVGTDTSTGRTNDNNDNYASWTFRKQPKFFDVVTWTGDGTANRAIPHNLGSQPGFITCKKTSGADAWQTAHRGNGTTGIYGFVLNDSAQGYSWSDYNTYITSTVFYPDQLAGFMNTNGQTYVAYLFAHNAGGFGLTGTDNVISCGSYTGNGSTNGPTVNLGYEPQWILVKNASGANPWNMDDNMRGWETGGLVQNLQANASYAESQQGPALSLNSTGFKVVSNDSDWNGTSATYIYIAIRRGPMKVPTSGTSVFSPIARTGTGATATVTGVGFPPDLVIPQMRDSATFGAINIDRLRGFVYLAPPSTQAEAAAANSITSFNMDGVTLGTDTATECINKNAKTYINWNFRRAPSFFDEVCYSGNSTAGRTLTHNLGVTPQLIIVKARTIVVGWAVYAESAGNTKYSELNDVTRFTTGINCWNDTSPTASVFSLSSNARVNRTGDTYVAYLFATCAGVSKVGSYTGTGSLQTINCGFTSGARFVLIKNQNVNGDWYVWDSARGISSSNDPYLLLNSTAAEVTNTNYVDTDSTGFKVTGNTAINTSSDTYIFLAIA